MQTCSRLIANGYFKAAPERIVLCPCVFGFKKVTSLACDEAYFTSKDVFTVEKLNATGKTESNLISVSPLIFLTTRDSFHFS